MKKIYLSPSNQSSNSYATGNTTEMIECDKIANATATALKRCGFEVKVGKSGDTMQNRCTESDNFKADIHMPIHTNAYNGKVTGGTRVFCLNSNGKKACESVLKYLGAISPGTGDSVSYQTGLYEINVPAALTVYVECEFHDTKTGSDWIRNNTTNIGEAICHGLCDYFGVTYKKTASTTTSSTSASTSSSTSKSSEYKVKVTISDLNIRKGAGTNYATTGKYTGKGVFTIVETKSGTGSTKGWGKLKSGAGWISLDYAQKI
jgi:hypothetical protein